MNNSGEKLSTQCEADTKKLVKNNISATDDNSTTEKNTSKDSVCSTVIDIYNHKSTSVSNNSHNLANQINQSYNANQLIDGKDEIYKNTIIDNISDNQYNIEKNIDVQDHINNNNKKILNLNIDHTNKDYENNTIEKNN
ncbi:hypothetical protein EDEG_00131, partial [Edhazardia aedis USNM 41457]